MAAASTASFDVVATADAATAASAAAVVSAVVAVTMLLLLLRYLLSVALKGLELVNPNADKEKKVMQANKKWFDSSSGFMSAKPK